MQSHEFPHRFEGVLLQLCMKFVSVRLVVVIILLRLLMFSINFARKIMRVSCVSMEFYSTMVREIVGFMLFFARLPFAISIPTY